MNAELVKSEAEVARQDEPASIVDAAEYHALPGLSNSGMKDLAVSPLRYWHLHVNPERPVEEPTPFMVFGSALHCLALEPKDFDRRYAREFTAEDDCLITIDDLRAFLRNAGQTPKGTRKAEVIAQVQAISSQVPIFDVMEREHNERHAGKTFLKDEDWARVHRAADSLLDEPHIQKILSDGQPEVSMFAKDTDTGVALKAKLDWVTPKCTLDLKTFSQKRGKSINRSIADAIFYEDYARQAVFYTTLRGLQSGQWPGGNLPDFVIVFCESEEPHEVRIRVLRPKTGGNPNLYWMRAVLQCRDLIRLYASCVETFGDKPWKSAQELDPLADEEMPGLAFS